MPMSRVVRTDGFSLRSILAGRLTRAAQPGPGGSGLTSQSPYSIDVHGFEEQRILEAREAAALARSFFSTITLLARSTSMMGMPAIQRFRIVARIRIDHVVCADDHGDIGRRQFGS